MVEIHRHNNYTAKFVATFGDMLVVLLTVRYDGKSSVSVDDVIRHAVSFYSDGKSRRKISHNGNGVVVNGQINRSYMRGVV